MKERIKEIYRDEINRIKKSITEIERIDILNKSLQKSNWLFIHPYNFGFEVTLLEKLSKEGKLTEQKIFEIYARSFLDLRTTSAFVEGFYKKRPFLKDYVHLIDQSIVLCLQKDFAGAINTIIPVIEGSIRNYLVSKGKESHKILKIEDLTKIGYYITDEYIELQSEYLETKYSHIKQSGYYFDTNQMKSIKNAHKRYIELWVGQLLNYLNNNLYLDTRKKRINDNLNRHIIFHGFESEIYYNFSNYLRIFNCLNFISWMFGVTRKECSILVDAEDSEINKKWIQYLKIVIISEALNKTKNEIYNGMLDNELNYFKYMDLKLIKPLKMTSILVEQSLKGVERLFKKEKNTAGNKVQNGK